MTVCQLKQVETFLCFLIIQAFLRRLRAIELIENILKGVDECQGDFVSVTHVINHLDLWKFWKFRSDSLIINRKVLSMWCAFEHSLSLLHYKLESSLKADIVLAHAVYMALNIYLPFDREMDWIVVLDLLLEVDQWAEVTMAHVYTNLGVWAWIFLFLKDIDNVSIKTDMTHPLPSDDVKDRDDVTVSYE